MPTIILVILVKKVLRKEWLDIVMDQGAKILAELNRRGIGYEVAYIWPNGTRKFERLLKKGKRLKIYCPKCNQNAEQNNKRTKSKKNKTKHR